MTTNNHFSEEVERLNGKSAARQRLEEQSRIRDLTNRLDTSAPPPPEPLTIQHKAEMRPSRKSSIKKIIAILVLIIALGALTLPAIGFGFTLFYATLSIYVYFGIIGFFVVLALIAIGWAVLTLMKE